LAPDAIAKVRPIVDLGRIWEQIGQSRQPKEFRVSCVRPDDLLVCDFIFDNLRLQIETGDHPKLVRKNPAAAATLIVEFPPQSFGEKAFLDATGPEVLDPPTGKAVFPESSDSSLGVAKKNVVVAGDDVEKTKRATNCQSPHVRQQPPCLCDAGRGSGTRIQYRGDPGCMSALADWRRPNLQLRRQTDHRRRNGWHELADYDRTMQLFMAFACLEGLARTIGIEEDADRIGRELP
jgi:hypothetical protein